MQYFRDAQGDLYAFEDDVVVTQAAGGYCFATADGTKLVANLTTLTPYTPPAPTEAQLLAAAQQAQIATLRAACAAAIIGGYSSAALGAAHTYPSAPTDQMNLGTAVRASGVAGSAADWTAPFWCEASSVWAFLPHTAAQIQQVDADWHAALVAAQARLATLSANVAAAATVTAVQAITW